MNEHVEILHNLAKHGAEYGVEVVDNSFGGFDYVEARTEAGYIERGVRVSFAADAIESLHLMKIRGGRTVSTTTVTGGDFEAVGGYLFELYRNS